MVKKITKYILQYVSGDSMLYFFTGYPSLRVISTVMYLT